MVLICISLMISDAEHLLMCLMTILYLLWKKDLSIQVSCPFFNEVVWFFDNELFELFIYFGYQPNDI